MTDTSMPTPCSPAGDPVTAACIAQARQVEREFLNEEYHHDSLAEMRWATTLLDTFGTNDTGALGVWL